MKTIEFKHVIPQVFSSNEEPLKSDVWNADVTFERGKRYIVEAESGKGKSTFCSYIMGYRHDYSSGSVLFDGRDSLRFSVHEWSLLRQKTVSCLFQELRLFPELTAMENVEIKNRITNEKSQGVIESWFERLGIADKKHVEVGRMSFGQQQRVAMIRSLVQPFDFLIVDEPVSHLDEANAGIMASLVADEVSSRGAAVIVTSIGKRLPLDYDYTLKL